ncbi:MAG: hypothetical protein QOG04_1554 [Actinomycetota bacterium]|jgi:hypothetical protein|nr:hypothetical protein [Actinomycetota bacterium]
MKKFAIPLVMFLFAGAACWPFDGEEALAAMTLRKPGGGKVQIVRASQETITVGAEDVSVQPGDIIRTYEGALAQVALEGERVAWVGGRAQPSAGVPQAEMKIVSTSSVENQTGTVMAEATDPMKIRFGDAVASGTESVFRVDRRSGYTRAASYEGTVRVAAPGEANVVLERLFEAPATASDLRAPRPYQLDPADPFDGKQLGDVIELEKTLTTLSLGFVNQLGKQKPPLAYFNAFAGNKDVSHIKRYMSRPTVDLLLGFTVALNTKAYPFADALDEAFRNRDSGGSWGVVASILRSNPKLLLADLEGIIEASQVVAGGTGENPVFSAGAAKDASSGVGSQPGDTSGGGDNGDGTVAQPPDDGGGNEPPPDQAEDCSSGPECDVKDITDGLPNGPTPQPSPSNILDGVKP